MKKFLNFKWLIAIFFGVILTYYFFYSKGTTNIKINNKYTEIKIDTFEIVVTCSGVVSALSSVDVKSRVGGTVEYLRLSEGDYVKKNDLIAYIDKRNILLKVKQCETDLILAQTQLERAKLNYEIEKKSYDNELRKAQANVLLTDANLKLLKKGNRPEEIASYKAQVDLMKANYENSLRNYNRNKELFEKQLISQATLDMAKTSYESALAQLKNAEEKYNLVKNGYQPEEIEKAYAQYEIALCALNDIKIKIESLKIREQEIKSLEASYEKAKIMHQDALEQLKDTTILAPISGIITQKWVDEGGIITSGISSVTAGTNIVTISDMSEVKIKANIDETDIYKIKPGLMAKVKLDAFQKRVFKAKLTNIGPRVYLKDNVPVIDVILDLLEGSNEVKVGMTADAEIIIESIPNAKLIPMDSLIEHNGKFFVRLMDNGSDKPNLRQVQIGQNNGEYAVLIDGLNEKEKFYTGEALKSLRLSATSKQLQVPLIGQPGGMRGGMRNIGGGSRGSR